MTYGLIVGRGITQVALFSTLEALPLKIRLKNRHLLKLHTLTGRNAARSVKY